MPGWTSSDLKLDCVKQYTADGDNRLNYLWSEVRLCETLHSSWLVWEVKNNLSKLVMAFKVAELDLTIVKLIMEK